MTDPRMEKLADILVNYCTSVKPGDWVRVRGHVLALPLITEVVQAVTRAGGNPTVTPFSEEVDEAFLAAANDAQLNWLSPLTKSWPKKWTHAL